MFLLSLSEGQIRDGTIFDSVWHSFIIEMPGLLYLSPIRCPVVNGTPLTNKFSVEFSMALVTATPSPNIDFKSFCLSSMSI